MGQKLAHVGTIPTSLFDNFVYKYTIYHFAVPMPKIDHDTKQKILAAAEQVFHRNGFKGARTVQIAEAAGISRTMLHYYFSTKEALFEAVLEDTLAAVLAHLKRPFGEAQTLEQILTDIINALCDVFEVKPHLPSFIVNILNESPELLLMAPSTAQDNLPALIETHLAEAQKAGRAAPNLTGEDIMLNLYGVCAMPYITAPYIAAKENRDEKAMKAFFKARRQKNLNFVLNGIRQ